MNQSRIQASVALLACLVTVSCAGSNAEADASKSPAAPVEHRDTTIVHEPCDGSSAGAVKIDVNGDGRPDIIHVMNGSKEVCRIVDLNLDGAVDAFIYYDDQGRERRRESDFDRDGRADEIAIYENGVLKLKMRETNFDNKIDTWDYYENGRLVRRERDSDGDGIIDQWWNFNNPQNPKCAVVAVDRNADGRPDPDGLIDLCGEGHLNVPKPAAAATPPASSGAPDVKLPSPGAEPKPPSAAAPPPPDAPHVTPKSK